MVSFSLTLSPNSSYITDLLLFGFFIISSSYISSALFGLVCSCYDYDPFSTQTGSMKQTTPVRVYLVPIETSNDAMIVSHWCDDSFFFSSSPFESIRSFIIRLLAIESQNKCTKWRTINCVTQIRDFFFPYKMLLKGQMELSIFFIWFPDLYFITDESIRGSSKSSRRQGFSRS